MLAAQGETPVSLRSDRSQLKIEIVGGLPFGRNVSLRQLVEGEVATLWAGDPNAASAEPSIGASHQVLVGWTPG